MRRCQIRSKLATPTRPATPVQFLPGCGARRGLLVQRLGVRTVRDLLFFFPRDYQDLTDLRAVDQLEEGLLVSVLGTVEEVELRRRPGGRSVLGVLHQARRTATCGRCGSISLFMRAKFQAGAAGAALGQSPVAAACAGRWCIRRCGWIDSRATEVAGNCCPFIRSPKDWPSGMCAA